MLLNKFFFISSLEHYPSTVKAVVSLEPSHPVFEGHFPDLPIVPGVAMMQLVREILEVQVGRKFSITAVDNMKFLAVLNPLQNKQVEVSVTYAEEDGSVLVNASLFDGNVTFFKLVRATFQYT
ncbi:MAG: hypothetical protein JNM57_13475 [Cyclobacteriaceae bacterium]|nr:hypothetical protein [Cyclobacteriaceae bacterium]